VLKLATMWRLLDTRALAISKVDAHVNQDREENAVERIVLAKKYHVSPWLRSGYISLAQKGVSPQDADTIGFETTFKICHLREASFLKCIQVMRAQGGYYYHHNDGYLPIANEVETAFADEFRQADSDSAEYYGPADAALGVPLPLE
jgi:hypothetical protein